MSQNIKIFIKDTVLFITASQVYVSNAFFQYYWRYLRGR